MGPKMGPKMDPQNGPKWGPKSGPFGVHFRDPVSGLCRCCLGGVLGGPRLSWEASGPRKPPKTFSFHYFLTCSFLGQESAG